MWRTKLTSRHIIVEDLISVCSWGGSECAHELSTSCSVLAYALVLYAISFWTNKICMYLWICMHVWRAWRTVTAGTKTTWGRRWQHRTRDDDDDVGGTSTSTTETSLPVSLDVIIYTVRQKPDCFWESITLRRLMGEGMWYVKSVRILSREKYKTCMSVHLDIICLICIKLHYTRNRAKFAKKAWILPNF